MDRRVKGTLFPVVFTRLTTALAWWGRLSLTSTGFSFLRFPPIYPLRPRTACSQTLDATAQPLGSLGLRDIPGETLFFLLPGETGNRQIWQPHNSHHSILDRITQYMFEWIRRSISSGPFAHSRKVPQLRAGFTSCFSKLHESHQDRTPHKHVNGFACFMKLLAV